MALISFLFVIVLLTSITLWKRYTTSKDRQIPPGLKRLPGPKGYPIIGSIPDIPEKNGHIKFADWGKRYGPIYQCNLAGTNHIWISSDQIAKDLLAKKGAIYSDRPHIPALMSDNRTSAQYLPLLTKNDAWTRQRKFATQIMRDSEKASFYHYPELEAKRMLVELMNDPSKYNHVLESFISRITCRLAWGHGEANEELKQRARELLIGVSPTGSFANKLPFLMSLPDWLSPAKAWERRRAKTERKFFETMQSVVEADIQNKVSTASWMRCFLESPAQFGFKSQLEGAYAVGMHGIAGALTIAAPMQTFCLAMCHYPQYLPMLQEEIDRVCGDRLPRAEDRPNLPFLRAIIRECFRWRPPVPTGIPHQLRQDDSYNGYHIPAGSVLHPLEWAISRDPQMYPDPETFNPLRWIKPEYPTYQEPLTQYPTIINCSQFGYGRRLCQGQSVADEDLLIGIGSMAWLFNIGKADEESDYNDYGEDTESDYDTYSESGSFVDEKRVPARNLADAKSLLNSSLASATISREELNTGMFDKHPVIIEESTGLVLNQPGNSEYAMQPPGSWPQYLSPEHAISRPLNRKEPKTLLNSSLASSTISREELNTGFLLQDTMNRSGVSIVDIDDDEYICPPGSWRSWFTPEPPRQKTKPKKKKNVDPTLEYSKLLIAKPLPFSFSLTVRNYDRATVVRKQFDKLRAEGEFKDSVEFWGPDQGKGKEFGWGDVFI